MSQEPVDPANWQIRENFNRVNKQNATLLTEIQEWGTALTRVGNALSAHPDAISTVNFTGLPSFRELHQAVQEIIGLRSRLNNLSDLAKKIGMKDLGKEGDSTKKATRI